MNADQIRKREQAVIFGDAMLPRGNAADRPCDRVGCGRQASELVGADGGSVLFVCASCAQQMTGTGTVMPQAEVRDVTDTQEIPVVTDQVAAPGVERLPVAGANEGRAVESRSPWTWMREKVPGTAWLFLIGFVALVVGLNVCAFTASETLGRVIGITGAVLCARCLVPRYRR